MTMNQPLQFSTPDDREELARAEVYGLLAQLFYAPPTLELYEQLQVAPTVAPAPGGFLEASWTALVAASRRLGLDEVRDEYEALFVGIGNEKPLVALRHDLRRLQLERPDSVTETEDHIASLCEVMRYLIAGDDLSVSNLQQQRRFFDAHLRGWVDALWNAIANHPRADFYRAVSLFARDFFSVEAQAFDLLDA